MRLFRRAVPNKVLLWGQADDPPGEGSCGRARAHVREEVRCSLGDTGGPVDIEVEFQFASGER